MAFQNRTDAGRKLVSKLSDYGAALVLALPRGGVPVAFEVARALDVPLDVFAPAVNEAACQPVFPAQLGRRALARFNLTHNFQFEFAAMVSSWHPDSFALLLAYSLAGRSVLSRGPVLGVHST